MPLATVSAVTARAAALAPGADPHAIARLPADQQVKAAAGQFEAILVRQFLEKSVGNLLGGGSDGAGSNVYGYLLTDTLANQLTAGGGLGLGKVLERQLAPHGATAAVNSPEQAKP
jgi:flagellar protein FlgJ